MPDSILRFKEVQARTGISRSSAHRKMALGEFPKPISLGARAVGWVESEVDKWIDQQIKQSRKGAA